MNDDRRYDDREVGLILKRVAELHEHTDAQTDARALTQVEIEDLVTELGISKALVTRAVAEMSIADLRERASWWLGGKTELLFEQVVDGAVDEATLTQMIEILRRCLGDPGELRTDAGARIWSPSTSRQIHFSVVGHAGKTTLRLEERMPIDARLTVGFPTGIGGFVGIMAMIPLKALVIKSVLLLAIGPLAATGAVVGWLGGRAAWKRHSTRRERQLRRAFDQIVELTER